VRALLIMTVMLIAVRERPRRLGTAFAGASKSMVIGAVLCEILLLSLIGSSLGCRFGFILAFGLQENCSTGHILRRLRLPLC